MNWINGWDLSHWFGTDVELNHQKRTRVTLLLVGKSMEKLIISPSLGRVVSEGHMSQSMWVEKCPPSSTHFNVTPSAYSNEYLAAWYMGFSFLCFFCQGHVGKIVTNRGKRHSSLWGNWFFKKNEIKAAHLSKYIWQKKIGFWE